MLLLDYSIISTVYIHPTTVIERVRERWEDYKSEKIKYEIKVKKREENEIERKANNKKSKLLKERETKKGEQDRENIKKEKWRESKRMRERK